MLIRKHIRIPLCLLQNLRSGILEALGTIGSLLAVYKIVQDILIPISAILARTIKNIQYHTSETFDKGNDSSYNN